MTVAARLIVVVEVLRRRVLADISQDVDGIPNVSYGVLVRSVCAVHSRAEFLAFGAYSSALGGQRSWRQDGA